MRRAANQEETTTDQGSEEKIPPMSSSPQVIQMESSPKMYRKEYLENQYVDLPSANTTHSHEKVSAYNPVYYGNGEVDIGKTNERHLVTTPPAYLGNPASTFF